MARMSMTDIERKYFDIANAADDAARAAIRAEEARRGSPLTAQEQEEYFRRAREGNERIIRQTRELHQQSRTFASGWQRAWRDYSEAAQDASKTAENVFRKATQGMEDALVNFVKTGRFEWKDFVADILEELLRSNIRELIASFGSALNLGGLFGGGSSGQGRGSSPNNPMFVVDVAGGGVAGGAAGGGGSLLGSIGNIFRGGTQPARTPGINPNAGGGSSGGFLGTIGNVLGSIGSGIGSAVKTVTSGIGSAIGGVVSGIRNIFGGFFANGGTLPAGKFGVVGERGPELISGPGTITPLGLGGGSTQVIYNINAVDARSFQQLLAQDPSLIYALTEQGRKSVAGVRR
jgi:phage-related minor tail protein